MYTIFFLSHQWQICVKNKYFKCLTASLSFNPSSIYVSTLLEDSTMEAPRKWQNS